MYWYFFVSDRDALDKAEKMTERLANISKDVLKVFEMVNPKDHKRYDFCS